MTDKKMPRQQLSKVTETLISPARIRRFIDDMGINRDVEEKLMLVKEELMKIKKEGGPQLPTSPETLKKDATESQRTKHEELRSKYITELKLYNDFISDKYKKLENIHMLCKHLDKIRDLLLKDKRNANQDRELSELLNVVHDRPMSRKVKETEDDFKNRVEKFEAPGYLSYVKGINLSNADDVQSLINNLKKNNNDLSLFFKRDDISRTRIRFNDPAAVAVSTIVETGLEELIEFGMDNTLKSQKKTLHPDNFIGSDLENCNWYILFKNLPHLQAVLNRQQRRETYETARNAAKLAKVQEAKAKARKTKKPYVKPDFKYDSFPETEVNGGFAVAEDVTTKDNKGKETTKTNYLWYGIDIDWSEATEEITNGKQEATDTDDDKEEIDDEDVEHEINFKTYVQHLCKQVITHKSDDKADFLDVKISSNARRFLSDLIVDFISRITPLIRILLEAMNVKTVDHEMIKTVLRIMLTDIYHSSTGNVQLNDTHEELFHLIDRKVKLCKDYQTGTVTKTEIEVTTTIRSMRNKTETQKDTTEVNNETNETTKETMSESHKVNGVSKMNGHTNQKTRRITAKA